MAKTVCPVTKKEFMEKAKSVTIDLAGTKMSASVKDFATGSFGWFINGKATLEVDGQPVQVQVGCNITVVGSKDAPRE